MSESRGSKYYFLTLSQSQKRALSLLLALYQHQHLPRACPREPAAHGLEDSAIITISITPLRIPGNSSFLEPRAQVLVLMDSKCFRRMSQRNRQDIPASHQHPTEMAAIPITTILVQVPTRAATTASTKQISLPIHNNPTLAPGAKTRILLLVPAAAMLLVLSIPLQVLRIQVLNIPRRVGAVEGVIELQVLHILVRVKEATTTRPPQAILPWILRYPKHLSILL